MYKIGFDNDKYLSLQSEKIKERIAKFGGKLYLEFGGKLFDDYHASRVLPGFHPDSKINMLAQLKDEAEIVIVINAADIEKNKVRSDLGITYDLDVLRLIDAFRGYGLYVGSVCLTRFAGQPSAIAYQKKLESLGMKVYRHYSIPGYPSNIPFIVSDEGYGKNDYIETSRSLVVVTAPGPGSGKMATCLSQLYHEYKRGIKAGYAKYETFPIWNIPLKHPVNLAYEAATADLNDVNMIDPFHLEAYGETTINYNRDVEIFPVVSAMFEKIMGSCPYKSPTDMGVNMAGFGIVDDEAAYDLSKEGKYFEGYSFFDKYKHPIVAIPDDLDYGEAKGNLIEEMRIDNEYIKNHPAEKPPTGEFATTPYDDYDELRNALIDIIPEFTMKLKVDPRTNRLEFSTDINSVFDIAWLTLARMLSEDPAPEDKGKSDNRPEGIMIRCRNCGKFIIRKSNRQEFCDAEECQKVRNARKQKAYRERKAIEKAQKSKKKAH